MTNDPTVLVTIHDQYGKPAIYPVNDAAQALARIAGTKTLTPRVLVEALNLGLLVQTDDTVHARLLESMLTGLGKSHWIDDRRTA